MRCEWIWGCLGNGEKREGMRRSYWGRRQGISRIWLGSSIRPTRFWPVACVVERVCSKLRAEIGKPLGSERMIVGGRECPAVRGLTRLN